MVKSIIKRVVLRMFPELSAGMHLPQFGAVVAVRETPAAGDVCDDFRPRYAVDVQMLDEYGNIDPAQPVFKDVILSLPVAGQEMGFFAYPEVGAWVELAFAYGSPNKPFIRSVLPHGLTLPDVEQGEQRWQHNPESYQRADKNGNWQRVSDQEIHDKSLTRVIEALEVVENFHASVKNTETNDTEIIGAIKRIEAFGAVVVQSGGVMDLSALDDLRLTTKMDMILRAVGKMQTTIDGNVTETVGGSKTAVVTGNDTLTTPHRTVNGKVTTTDGDVALDGGGGKIVTTLHICAFTGKPHIDGSSSCQAKL